jgi:hypothetical protein
MELLRGIGQQVAQGSALASLLLMLALIMGPRVAETVRLPM